MQLHQLPKLSRRSSKRVGRGVGSGKGSHTSGRGTKGQKAREKVPLIFEGTKFKKSLIKRLPFLRGKGKLKPWGKRPVVLNWDDLEGFSGKTITLEALVKAGIVGEEAMKKGVKILGRGKAPKNIEVKVPTSYRVAKKLGSGDGKIESA
jgi:large subunit ribosomal protein L15